jgi:hypothetical protein
VFYFASTAESGLNPIPFHSIHGPYDGEAANHTPAIKHRRRDAASIEISFPHTDGISCLYYQPVMEEYFWQAAVLWMDRPNPTDGNDVR